MRRETRTFADGVQVGMALMTLLMAILFVCYGGDLPEVGTLGMLSMGFLGLTGLWTRGRA